MDITKQVKNQHLLWRAGFGPASGEGSLLDMPTRKLFKKIEEAALEVPSPFDIANPVPDIAAEKAKEQLMAEDERKAYVAERKQKVNKQTSDELNQLTTEWMDAMVTGAGLREKMTLFWHGHFASRVYNSLYMQQLLNTIRAHALGSFGDLLRAVSKSATMLSFLNGAQNKKEHPNENFARELLELFTMGRNNYTEQDIKEAARAFTGWAYTPAGNFTFRSKYHDEGTKTILGVTGNLDGDKVLDIILRNKQTAVYITRKIYRYLVNEIIDEGRVDKLAERFYSSNYNIAQLMHDIFTSDWFYEPQHIGTRIKSPVEYLTGIRRFLPMSIQNEGVLIVIQRALGQWIFNPPNVAGWPGGYAWIDSSSLMLRLRIPKLIVNEEAIDIKVKSNDDVAMGKQEMLPGQTKSRGKGNKFQIMASVDWNAWTTRLNGLDEPQIYQQLEAMLLQTAPGTADKNAVLKLVKHQNREDYIKTLIIALMSTPEYQLC